MLPKKKATVHPKSLPNLGKSLKPGSILVVPDDEQLRVVLKNTSRQGYETGKFLQIPEDVTAEVIAELLPLEG